MSKIHIEKVTCPNCNYIGEYKVYDSININDEMSINKEFKNKIIDHSLFLYTCSKCNSKFYIDYPFLYNDVENSFMIWCLPENATKSEIDNIRKVDMRTYKGTLRIAIGQYSFLDKLNVFENKMDDLIIESIKDFIVSKLQTEQKSIPNQIIFNGINVENKTLEFIFINDNNTSKMYNVPRELYVEINNQLKEKEVKGFEIIDRKSYYNYIEND